MVKRVSLILLFVWLSIHAIGQQDAARLETLQTEDDKVIQFAEKAPEYPGGVLTYIYKNLRLPQDTSSEAKFGTVYVSFIVELDGSVSHVKIVKGILNAPMLNAEIVRVISTMPPNWKPAEMNGKPIRLSMTLPIRIESK